MIFQISAKKSPTIAGFVITGELTFYGARYIIGWVKQVNERDFGGRAISKSCSSTTKQQSAVRVLSIPAIHYLYISRLDC